MKKIYQAPNTQVVLVQNAQVLTSSLGVYDGEITGSEMLSRKQNKFTFEDDTFNWDE